MPAVAAAGGGAGKVWVNSKSKTYQCEGTKFYASSVKSVGELRLRKLAKYVIQGEFSDSEGAKALGFFHGHFDFVVQALDNATGELLFRAEVVEDQFAVAAQGLGHLLHRLNA